VDVRYRGQGYELNVPFTRNLIHDFQHEHERRYGYKYPAREVELVTLRLRATIKSRQSSVTTGRAGASAPDHPSRARLQNSRLEHASVFFGGKKISTVIHERESLPPGKKYSGPAVITEYSATATVPSGMHFWADKAGNLVIETRASRG
jgi:N-methylhydantoinase A